MVQGKMASELYWGLVVDIVNIKGNFLKVESVGFADTCKKHSE